MNPYPFLFRLLHWLLIPSMLVLILTGFSLHAGTRPEWSLFGGKVAAWMWTGRVHYWHAWAALVFAPAILAACWSYAQRRVAFRPTHLVLLVGGLLTVLSGLFLQYPPSTDLLYRVAVWAHATIGLVVLPVWFLWHLATGFTRYLNVLVAAFHPWAAPRLLPVAGWLALAVATTYVLLGGWPLQWPPRDLRVVRIEKAAAVEMAELPWNNSTPLAIQLVNGVGFDGGRTRVVMQALHNGDEVFIKAVWADPLAQFDYWPWKKTISGWEYVQTSANDECHCYEDKFSLFFPIQHSGDFERFGCAASCHLDSRHGWGYKGSRDLLDTWHWKAARTDPVGQVDDQYCDVVDFSQKDCGRHGDPNTGGGYVVNRAGPKSAEPKDRPLFLPDGPHAAFHGAMTKAHAVKYSDAAAAALPVGAVVPGVIVEPFQGDRGNVRCQSEHRAGQWTLYIRRKLSTDSKHDAQFAPGGRYAFSCAAFDHAGKRHAYAPPVFHMVLEP
jgi:Ni,Fe-hydrogenase I cytochrome b subunit